MRYFMVFISLLALTFVVHAQDEATVYAMSTGDIQFTVPPDWIVTEVDPVGSAIIVNNEETYSQGPANPGGLQMSVFSPNLISQFHGDEPDVILESFAEGFAPIPFDAAEDISLGDWTATIRRFSNPPLEGFLIVYPVGDELGGGLVIVPEGELAIASESAYTFFASVEFQPDLFPETETYVTGEIGIFDQIYQFDHPEGWTVVDNGNVIWVMNVDDVNDFADTPDAMIAVVSPIRTNDVMTFAERPLFETDNALVIENPLTAGFNVSGIFSDPDDIELGEDYALSVQNVSTYSMLALSRVIHHPDMQAEANALLRLIEATLMEAIPEGMTLYQNAVMSVALPETWVVIENENGFLGYVPDGGIAITIDVERVEFVMGAAEQRFLEWADGRGMTLAPEEVGRLTGEPRMVYYGDNPDEKTFFAVNYEFQFVFLIEVSSSEPLSDEFVETMITALLTVNIL